MKAEVSKNTLTDKFKAVRQRTEKLCAPLKIEDYVPQADVFVSPTKWHLAHTTWFFEEMILSKYAQDYEPFNANFGFLFNSYYNTVGERTLRQHRGLMTRPTVEEVFAYREYVDERMLNYLNQDLENDVFELVTLGLNHEQQHQELLVTDLKYTLSLNPIHPVYHNEANWTNDGNQETGWLSINEGIFEIGFKGNGFCFDNELNPHKVLLNDFSISKSLVTNGEFLEFIESGGYKKFNYWLDEGWAWVQEQKITSPLYWKKIDGTWYNYTLAGLKPLDLNAMLCHINYFEANAYAQFKGCRLPSEFEWEVASGYLNWGKRWEWTSSSYQPYPKFKISDGAVGEYNGKFMVNQMVLRGGSVVTAPKHSRKTYRNFFHPHHQWQYAGIRLAK